VQGKQPYNASIGSSSGPSGQTVTICASIEQGVGTFVWFASVCPQWVQVVAVRTVKSARGNHSATVRRACVQADSAPTAMSVFKVCVYTGLNVRVHRADMCLQCHIPLLGRVFVAVHGGQLFKRHEAVLTWLCALSKGHDTVYSVENVSAPTACVARTS
jgi:hypothetical protein